LPFKPPVLPNFDTHNMITLNPTYLQNFSLIKPSHEDLLESMKLENVKFPYYPYIYQAITIDAMVSKQASKQALREDWATTLTPSPSL
jgi:hypothetical protein